MTFAPAKACRMAAPMPASMAFFNASGRTLNPILLNKCRAAPSFQSDSSSGSQAWDGASDPEEMAREIRRLNRENAYLRRQRDILKKAAMFLMVWVFMTLTISYGGCLL